MLEEQLGKLIDDAGFDQRDSFDANLLEVRQDVRDMCSADTCKAFGRSWSCPPACGTLEECTERMGAYNRGIVFQTIGKMDDEFDFGGIQRAEAAHKTRFNALRRSVIDAGLANDVLLLSAGTCTLCEKCTYPDGPCIHPDLMCPSMEACGLLVTQVCQQAGATYYHGPCTTAFFSAVLF